MTRWITLINPLVGLSVGEMPLNTEKEKSNVDLNQRLETDQIPFQTSKVSKSWFFFSNNAEEGILRGLSALIGSGEHGRPRF